MKTKLALTAFGRCIHAECLRQQDRGSCPGPPLLLPGRPCCGRGLLLPLLIPEPLPRARLPMQLPVQRQLRSRNHSFVAS